MKTMETTKRKEQQAADKRKDEPFAVFVLVWREHPNWLHGRDSFCSIRHARHNDKRHNLYLTETDLLCIQLVHQQL